MTTPESKSSPPTPQSKDSAPTPTFHRRNFFQEAMKLTLEPVLKVWDHRVAKVIQAGRESMQHGLDQPHVTTELDNGGEIVAEPTAITRWLRPPGAVDANAATGAKGFSELCTKCGKCVEVCPAQAIQMDVSGKLAGGLPYLIARHQACVVCDTLACMHHCPDGALALPQATPGKQREQIRMGIAKVNQNQCLRTDDDIPGNQRCQVCVDICPLGEMALVISPRTGLVRVNHPPRPGTTKIANKDNDPQATGEDVQLRDAGCIGCGLCEQVCPAEAGDGEKAIIVLPQAGRMVPEIV